MSGEKSAGLARGTLALASMALAAVVGCQLAPLSSLVARAPVPEPIMLEVGQPHPDADRVTNAQDGTGKITLQVRWPEAGAVKSTSVTSTTYRAQILPTSATRIAVSIKNGSATVGSATLVRSPGEATSSATIKLKAASDLAVTVKALPASSVADGTACSQDSDCGTVSACLANQCATKTVATATASVDVVKDQTTSLTLTLAAQFLPVVTNVSESAGELVVTGANFSPPHLGGVKPTVIYTKTGGTEGTVPAEDIVLVDDTQFSVSLPDDAIDGSLKVSTDGVLSTQVAYTVPVPTPTPVVSAAPIVGGFSITQPWPDGGHENVDSGGNLYLSNGNDILKVPNGSTTPEVLVAGAGAKTVMVGLDGALWWGGQGFIKRSFIDGTGAATLVSGLPGTATGFCMNTNGVLFMSLYGGGFKAYDPNNGTYLNIPQVANSTQAVSNVCGSLPRSFVQLKDSGVFHLLHQDGVSNYIAGSGLPSVGSGVARPAAFLYYAIYGNALWKMTGDQGSFTKTQLQASGFYNGGATNIASSDRTGILYAGDGSNVVSVNLTTGAKTVLFSLATPHF